jgi:hypothetical protein
MPLNPIHQAFAKARKNATVLSVALILFGVSVVQVGCGTKGKVDSSQQTQRRSNIAQGQDEHLREALGYVFDDDRAKYDVANKAIASALNNWVRKATPSTDWKPSPLVETLPAYLREQPRVKQLDELKFDEEDAYYLHESSWMYRIAGWVTNTERIINARLYLAQAESQASEAELKSLKRSRKKLTVALSILHPELWKSSTSSGSPGNPEGVDATNAPQPLRDMTATVQIFDWTIRNIQLSRLINEPTPDDIRSRALRTGNFSNPEEAAIPGPGYQRTPWVTLAMAQGDAWDRARVFMGILRQINVESVLLGVKDDSSPTGIKYWAVGVLLNGQLYLFDTNLGIPIPGPGQKGIATLAQVQADPKLISSLDLTPAESLQDIDYPISESQVKSVIAFIDAPAQSLSMRMAMLQPKLVERFQMQIFPDIDQIAETLKALAGIEEVRLLPLPMRAELFRQSATLVMAERTNQVRSLPDFAREKIFHTIVALPDGGFVGLPLARYRFLTGVLQDEVNPKNGSSWLFYRLRLTDKEIDRIDTDADWRAIYNLDGRDDLTQSELQAMIDNIKLQLKEVRLDASFMLILSHFENGDPESTLSWAKELNDAPGFTRWIDGLNYIKARSYEARMEYDKAIAALAAEKSIQVHGNILRSRLIKQWMMQGNSSSANAAANDEK